ncbi:unnamed protein product [Ectocarpus sp. 12 AP-2014]
MYVVHCIDRRLTHRHTHRSDTREEVGETCAQVLRPRCASNQDLPAKNSCVCVEKVRRANAQVCFCMRRSTACPKSLTRRVRNLEDTCKEKALSTGSFHSLPFRHLAASSCGEQVAYLAYARTLS